MKENTSIIGETFGELLVLELVQRPDNISPDKWAKKWLCKCSCGELHTVHDYRLRKGLTTMCVKCAHKKGASKMIPDLTNQIFGELTVIRRATKEERSKEVYWLCKCSCGKESFVKTGNLRNGHCTRCWECAHQQTANHKKIDLVGQRFG